MGVASRPLSAALCCASQAAVSGDSTNVFLMTASGLTVRIWNDAGISRRDSDGYVNATAMCQANGKRWENYHRCQRTQEYIAALSQHLGAVMGNPTTGIEPQSSFGAAVALNRATGLVHTIQGGTPALQGTWIHPRLAVDLARWISPAFAVWMDGWFLESVTTPQQPLQQALLEPQAEGVAVFAQTKRQAADLWRKAIQLEINSALSHRFGPHLTEPRLHHCRWMPVDPPITRDEVATVVLPHGGFTTHTVLDALNKPITRSNEMYTAAQLRELGFVKRRRHCDGQLAYIWHRVAA